MTRLADTITAAALTAGALLLLAALAGAITDPTTCWSSCS